MTGSLVIWRLSDGKRGHDNQSLGLLDALARQTPVHNHELPLKGQAWKLTCLALLGRRPANMPTPHVLIGAGHGTHVPLLVLARRYRARSIVLMKPDLPLALFSDCLIPEHDGVPPANNVLTTRGALNRIRPGSGRRRDLGIILIGGPSRHHLWDPEALIKQIRHLTAANTGTHWHVAGSRRTPEDTLRRLNDLHGVEVHPFAATTDDWLPAMLSGCTKVWVTADSVSMAYEAVSSGAATGILEVPLRSAGSRVERALRLLLDSQMAISFCDWRSGREMAAPDPPLREADRCARWILARLQTAGSVDRYG